MYSKYIEPMTGLVHCIVLLHALISLSSDATTGQPQHQVSSSSGFGEQLLVDQKAFWTSPAKVQLQDLRWMAPIAVATGALFKQDTRINEKIGEDPDLRNVSRKVSYFGSAPVTFGAAGAVYGFGKITNRDHLADTGLLGLQALIGANLVVQALKFTTGRSRPDASDSRGEFLTGGKSFPSGHAASTFALAAVVAGQYPDKPALVVMMYGMAAAVGLSRITGQKHYSSDVLVGSAIGYLIGRYVMRVHHRAPSSRLAPVLEPFVSGKQGYGLQATFQW